jgi:hypothetical protein
LASITDVFDLNRKILSPLFHLASDKAAMTFGRIALIAQEANASFAGKFDERLNVRRLAA